MKWRLLGNEHPVAGSRVADRTPVPKRASCTACTLRAAKPSPALPSPPPSGSNWIHEIKHDGFRLMARRDPVGAHYPGSPIKEIGANAAERRSMAIPRKGLLRRSERNVTLGPAIPQPRPVGRVKGK